MTVWVVTWLSCGYASYIVTKEYMEQYGGLSLSMIAACWIFGPLGSFATGMCALDDWWDKRRAPTEERGR